MSSVSIQLATSDSISFFMPKNFLFYIYAPSLYPFTWSVFIHGLLLNSTATKRRREICALLWNNDFISSNICLDFFCQYHATLVTVALKYFLKPGFYGALNFVFAFCFLCLKLLGYLWSVCFHVNFSFFLKVPWIMPLVFCWRWHWIYTSLWVIWTFQSYCLLMHVNSLLLLSFSIFCINVWWFSLWRPFISLVKLTPMLNLSLWVELLS